MINQPPTEEGLEVIVTPEGDGTVELRARVNTRGFAGHGSAWFSEEEIRSFAASLQDYPLKSDSVLQLQGGYSSTFGRRLKEIHVSIAVYTVNARGQLGARVVLADPLSSDGGGSESQNRTEAELLTTYDCLGPFGKQLASFAGRAPTRAFLKASVLA